ncbi:sensor histidine kinase [Streptomyces ipomoeae]|uniref:Histidine kinase n=3 Tax=Streptomyces ipomoeae TaxID=103232 RepID=L1KZ27_9ACTN|nr:histidine kinase [Streptomyces ipomoeae]EKX65877.1 histidine kinase [Streptomyces ipomoeae 91-03]MDX2824668.1 histidine kinase [Streptomyces ipomoeae]MDX2842972.1 histidine kinase [Streptomyces ipomoeae]MDX2877610.1 histidine kinase [Streptomyces ipomoeae]TQE20183.1 sensor histidine kinase [Streptomyces ipomoeae]
MRGPVAWWRGKTTPAKVETYTRWSFHSFPLFEVVAFGLPLFGKVPMPHAGWLFALLCVHGTLCAVTGARALDWVRGRRDQPLRLMWAVAVASMLIGGAAFVLAGREAVEDAATALGGMFGGVMIFGVGGIALGIRSRRSVLYLVAGFSVSSWILGLVLGATVTDALAVAIGVLLGTSFFAFTAVFSVWLLKAVYELDAARETRARLAVAEERLRFGRDLHDVIGRNLAVIALKSELAIQLARRERPEAVEQMIEVQRIAQESQREVREVVRGYREADLGVELAGAQGVLEAAGIDCSVDGAVDTSGLPGEVQSALAWVVREGATNVLRHGNAGQCAVTLRVTEGQVVLTVENDGIRGSGDGPVGDGSAGGGSVGSRSVGAGSGLAGLRERLAIVDGVLEAGPVAGGEAFRVVARVPLASGGASVAAGAGVVREVAS